MKIDSHTFGRITIDGRVYTRDVVIYPERVDDQWWRKEGHELCPQDLTEILDQAPEILVVGTGDLGCMRVLAETKELLKARGVQLIECSTRRACEEYNRLSGGKKVIAALHLTC
ncbi:MAG TPA: Mth938-like domain-containing protein [Nitrospiria bacterium]|nr:Mth938-like domain-containing protein [Nitrospiria bacterium]